MPEIAPASSPPPKPESPSAPFYPFFRKLLAGIGVIALLLVCLFFYVRGIGRPGYSPFVRVEAEIRDLALLFQLFQSDTGRYPSTAQGLAALDHLPRGDPAPGHWRRMLDEVPTDPWGNAYRYEFPARRSKQAFDLYSCGPDRTPNTSDDIGNWPSDAK